MKAKEFIVEYRFLPIVNPPPQEPYNPIKDSIKRMNYLLKCGEAISLNHALKIVAAELVNEFNIDYEDAITRIKEQLKNN